MKKIYWRLAEHNAYIGIQCKEYQKRHKFIWGRRWWFLIKCTVRNWFRGNYKGCYITEDEILKKISEYEIISFDIFDTLLVRPYKKPTDLFYDLEKQRGIPGFAEKRIFAEKMARKENKISEDIKLEQIYEVLDVSYKKFMKMEIELEQEVLHANGNIKKIYDEADKLQRKIIVVSDMYLSKELLSNILKYNGYRGYENLFVSSDLGVTKRSGNMFFYVMKRMNKLPQSFLHIGDDFYSDGNACWKAGMSYLYVDRTEEKYVLVECGK